MKKQGESILRNLKTAKGQIDGLIKMIEENRYCIDISNQILATRAILDRVNRLLIEGHMETCVFNAANSGTEEDRKEKIEELSALMKKMMK